MFDVYNFQQRLLLFRCAWIYLNLFNHSIITILIIVLTYIFSFSSTQFSSSVARVIIKLKNDIVDRTMMLMMMVTLYTIVRRLGHLMRILWSAWTIIVVGMTRRAYTSFSRSPYRWCSLRILHFSAYILSVAEDEVHTTKQVSN